MTIKYLQTQFSLFIFIVSYGLILEILPMPHLHLIYTYKKTANLHL